MNGGGASQEERTAHPALYRPIFRFNCSSSSWASALKCIPASGTNSELHSDSEVSALRGLIFSPCCLRPGCLGLHLCRRTWMRRSTLACGYVSSAPICPQLIAFTQQRRLASCWLKSTPLQFLFNRICQPGFLERWNLVLRSLFLYLRLSA